MRDEDAEAVLVAPETVQVPEKHSGFLVYCAIVAACGMGIQSFNANYTSPTIADHCGSPDDAHMLNCQLQLSDTLVSVYAALTALTAIAGAAAGSMLVDRVGRQRVMMCTCIPYTAGWLMTALVPDPPAGQLGHSSLSSATVLVLLGGRVLLGCGGGLAVTAIGPWITEAAPPDLRGAFATLFQVLAVSGIGVMYLAGIWAHWRGIAWGSVAGCVVYSIALFNLPESPKWLYQKGRHEEAEAVLRRIRAPGTDISAVIDSWRDEAADTGAAGNGLEVLHAMWHSAARRPLLIAMALMVFQNLSGVNAVILTDFETILIS